MDFLSIEKIFFTVLDYPMSYIEFFGTITGAIAVWLAAKTNPVSWPIGLVSVALLFFLFYQVQLYPDMGLQIYFLVTNLLGWYRWKNPKTFEADRKQELKVTYLTLNARLTSIAVMAIGTALLGSIASKLHFWFPVIFTQPSAFPFADSFVTVTSLVAQYWLLQKKAECWLFWCITDVVATTLYFSKGIKFLGLEYFIFTLFAVYGFWSWIKESKTYTAP